MIWIIYDRARQGSGDILMARFQEEDIAAGRVLRPASCEQS